VRTYIAQKDWEKAESLCQKLAKSPKLSVQQWAAKMLQKIEQQNPSVAPAITGRSGFQPLSPAPTSPEDGLKKGAVSSSAVSSSAVSSCTEPVPVQGSMFDYSYLNGDADEVDIDASVMPESALKAASIVDSPPPVARIQTPSNEAMAQASYTWMETGRLKQGRSLGKMKRSPLLMAQLGGAIAFYCLSRYLLFSAISQVNHPLNFLDSLLPFWIRQIPFDAKALSWQLLLVLCAATLASPWLWDVWLRLTANRKPFSNQKLRNHSPEAAAVLAKQCTKRGWSFPTLWKLPTDVPLIFSYGWLPRNTRLVVSDGLLTQLEPDEIAALIAYEMSHWKSGYFALLSLQGFVLQLFHQLYWQLALWGNQQPVYFKWPAGAIATLSYCAFWLLRLPGLWVSRVRTYYGDRAAAAATGNPNGLAKALTKLSFAGAASVEHQGYTPALLESVTLLLPVSPDSARYQLYGRYPLSQLFAWDSLNPLRGWMSLGDAHPPLGDRLRLIMAYAQHWKLDMAVVLPAPPRRRKGLSLQSWLVLFQQATPFVGFLMGAGVGVVLWVVGAIAHQADVPALDWMHNDMGLFQGCCLLGFGVGTLLWINPFFPDLSIEMPVSQDLPHRISDPNLLPASSLATRLSGTVMGRPGIANWLGQDLFLKTERGLHKLRYFSALGPFGNGVGLGDKPTAVIGKSVHVLGWFRRGTHPWIDVDKLRLANGHLLLATYPIFALLIAALSSGMGLWLLVQLKG
ncbi:MAG: M48 family metalloprotease, partial [Cyanobacteria bacterium J06559_1]